MQVDELCTVGWGKGGSDPVAQMRSGVGPNQFVTNSFYYSKTLILPGTFKQHKNELLQYHWINQIIGRTLLALTVPVESYGCGFVLKVCRTTELELEIIQIKYSYCYIS